METAVAERKEVLDFKFGRLCNLRLFSNTKLNRSNPLNVVATSNKFGLLFAGTPSGVQCIPLLSVIELQQKRPNNRGCIENYPRRELNLGCAPSHVAMNSSGDLLGVVISHQDCPVLQVYVVQSFASQNIAKMSEMRLSSSPGTKALDLQWNPAVPNVIGAVVSDGSAMVCEINLSGGAPTISSTPPSAQAMCLCWSPKGKQVVIGSKTGILTQCKPDMKPVKSYPPPQIPNTQQAILSVHWLSNFQFIAVYKNIADPEGRSFVMIVNVPKNGPQSFVNFEDVCFGSDTMRPEHFFVHIAAWNILIISTGNGLEVGVLHQEGEKWVQWLQDEGGRAELPQTENHDDVFTVGMALNFNATQPIPIGDSGSLPPMPYLLYMAEEGVLCIFHTINLLPGSPSVCNAPQDISRQFFIVPEANEPATQTQAPASSPAQKPIGATAPLMGIGSGDAPPASQAPAKTATSFFSPSSSSLFQLPTSQPSTQNVQPQVPSGFQASLFGSAGTPQAPPQQKSPLTSQPQTVKPPSQFQWGMPQQKAAPTSLFGAPASKPAEPSSAAPTPGPTDLPSSGLQMQPSVITPTTSVAPMPKQPLTSSASVTPTAKPSQATSQPPPPTPKESTPVPAGPPPVDDEMIEKEILKEVAAIENLLSGFKVDTKAVKNLMNDKTSLASVAVKLDGLEKFEKELRETTSAEHAEVRMLRSSLIEMWGWLENIKAKQRQSTSQRYLDTIESKELDPLLKKLMKNIDHHTLYVETKIKEATDHLNSIWEKQKEPGSIKNFDIPHMEVIYQTMAANMKILAAQQARVAELEAKLANSLKARKKTIPRILSNSNSKLVPLHHSTLISSDMNSQLEKLADNLLQTRIDSDDVNGRSFKETSNRYIALTSIRKPLPSGKEAALWEWHKSHKVIHTKVARAGVPDNELLSRLSLKVTPVKTSAASEQSAPIVETPLVASNKPISRNLFVTPAVAPPLVTSTPMAPQLNPDEPKGAGRGFLSPITQSTAPVSFSKPSLVVESKKSSSQAPALKPIFGSSTSVSSAKDQTQSTVTVTAAETGTSSFQFSSPKPPSSEASTFPPFSVASSKPKEPLKTQVPKENQTFILDSSKTAPPTSEAKPQTSSIFGSLSGTTITVASDSKDKAQTVAATTSSSIFGNSPFGQTSGISFAGSTFGGFSATTTSATVTSATTTTTKPSIFGQLASAVSSSTPSVSVFSLGTALASDAKLTTTTSSLFPTPSTTSQGLFSSGFNFNQSKTSAPLLTTAGGTSTVASSLSSPSVQPTTTVTTSIFGGSLTAVGATKSSSSDVPSVTSSATSANSSAVSTASATQISSSSAPPTTFVSIFGGAATTSSVLSPVSPNLVTPEKVASSEAGSINFGSMVLTPAATSQSSVTTTSDLTTAVSSFSFGSAFGTATTTSSLFGTTVTAVTSGGTLFQTPQKSTFSAASAQPLFGSPTTTMSQPAFGTPTTPAAQPEFGTPATSAQPAFGTPTTPAQSIFGSSATSPSAQTAFGTPTTSPQPTFGTPTAPGQSNFGAAPAAAAQPSFGTPTTIQQQTFGATTSAQSTFGTSTSAPAFGTTSVFSTTSSSSIFGAPTTSTTSVFGAPTTSTTSVFGAPTTSTTSVFGAANALSNTSFFGSPATTASGFGSTGGNIFGGTSSFSTPATTSSSIFGAPICSPDSTSTAANKNVFGSPFSPSNTGTAFGGTPSFGSFRPNTPGTFGTSGGSIFGGGSSTFGQPQPTGGLFQSGNSSQSVFGSPSSQQQTPGAFSSGGQSIQQAGFGSFGSPQAQQTNRPFGSSGGAIFGGQAAFGSPPTFGGTATFGGSPTNKIFGSSATPAAPAFGSPTQQSSTFENLAGQNTVSFGNLAQNQQPTFGSGGTSAFGIQQQQPQQQPQQQQQPAFSSTPAFGGSSFSSWR